MTNQINNNLNNNNHVLPTNNNASNQNIPKPSSNTQNPSCLSSKKVIQAPCKSQTSKERLMQPIFFDPFTSVATTAYGVHSNAIDLGHPFRVVEKNESLSLVENVPLTDSSKKENREILTKFRTHIIQECGIEKVQQIEKDYKINLIDLLNSGKPLTPHTIFAFNVGMNNIEMTDFDLFQTKLNNFQNDATSKTTLASYFEQCIDKNLVGNKGYFSLREMQNLMHFYGPDTDRITVAKQMNSQISKVPDEDQLHFFLDIQSVPKTSKEAMLTGRKAQQIKGDYFSAPDSDFHPEIDQEELLQIFPQLESPMGDNIAPYAILNDTKKKQFSRIFNELLVKVVVKKHLMRFDGKQFRVGALIPSPFRDNSGHTVWYRVEEGVDSGFGKMWYAIAPASDSYDPSLPTYRVCRDTSIDSYAQSGAPTWTRDFNLGSSAGYKFSESTEKEDAAFFKQFTIPNFLADLALADKEKDLVKKGKILKKGLENLLSNQEYALTNEQKKDLYVQLTDLTHAMHIQEKNPHIPTALPKYLFEAETTLQKFATKEDFSLYTDYIKGKGPTRPLNVLGNSLGGFDTQYDLVRQLADKSRVPLVPINLYGHSSVRIENKDNKNFISYLKNNQESLRNMKVNFSFDYITEDKDFVPKIGNDHTYLGDSEDKDIKDLINLDFRVFSIKETTKNPDLKINPHFNRVEKAKPEDYTVKGNLKQYNLENNESYWELGRKTISVITSPFESMWKIKRSLYGRRGLESKGLDKIHVKYKGKMTQTPAYQDWGTERSPDQKTHIINSNN